MMAIEGKKKMKNNKETLQVLIESYLQHKIQVSFTGLVDFELVQFIPDTVKEQIAYQLSDNSEGEFTSCQTGGYEGTWRIVRTDHSQLHKIAMWEQKVYPIDMCLKESDFIKWFGKFDGTNLYERWINYYKCDFLSMVSHFSPQNDNGQPFCDMVIEQANKYQKLNGY